MKRSTFLALTAVLAMLIGISLLLSPDKMFTMMAMTVDAATILTGRLVGAFLFSLGLINWTARNVEDSVAVRAILYGNLSAHVLGLVVDIIGVTSGVVNGQAWGSAVMHVILGIGFAYYAFAKPQAA
jgi:hypothetical protein